MQNFKLNEIKKYKKYKINNVNKNKNTIKIK